jgi:hypothetical protein
MSRFQWLLKAQEKLKPTGQVDTGQKCLKGLRVGGNKANLHSRSVKKHRSVVL